MEEIEMATKIDQELKNPEFQIIYHKQPRVQAFMPKTGQEKRRDRRKMERSKKNR